MAPHPLGSTLIWPANTGSPSSISQTYISFRLGAEDAEDLAREFRPEFAAHDLEGLGQYNICLRLVVNGVTSRPFSATTLPPAVAQPNEENWENILKTCRRSYTRPREEIETKIANWMANIEQQEAKRRTQEQAVRGSKWRPGARKRVIK